MTTALATSGLGEREPRVSAAELCARTLAQHSKSFALAGKMLTTRGRRDAAVLYTYCRVVDDAVDLCPLVEQPAALARLRAELDSVYKGEPQQDIRLLAFQELVMRVGLPRQYPEELLAGMAMDVAGARYETLDDLLQYCHRVAGVVGLMMCHVLGVSDAHALRNAAHLGIAMQLTNICRDVQEDWQRGRLYLPRSWLRRANHGVFSELMSASIPEQSVEPLARVTRELLQAAEPFYRSADQGLSALPLRAAFAVRAARSIYHAIGAQVLAQQADPRAARAVVSSFTKLRLLLGAALRTARELPQRWLVAARIVPLTQPCRFPDDILPL